MTSAAHRPHVLLLGCGKMGSALAQGWCTHHVATVTAVDPIKPSSNLKDPKTKAMTWYAGLEDVPPTFQPAAVVIALKPQSLESALPAYGTRFPQSVFLSIAAGQCLENLENFLGAGNQHAVVRAMPNIPASIGQGMTVAVANPHVTPAQRDVCETLMKAAGEVAWLDSESHLDAVTALSGSGPAYVFALVEAMAVAGVRLGLPLELAQRLARQTLIGSGSLLHHEETRDAAELRQAVTSPGGTTEAALRVLLAENGLQDLMIRAMREASQRSKELRDSASTPAAPRARSPHRT